MRLIDADVLWEWLYNEPRFDNADRDEIALPIVNAIPTVDAEVVVRCKDCKHYRPQKKSAHWENRANYCNRIVTIRVQPYDFCSYGERKEGAD